MKQSDVIKLDVSPETEIRAALMRLSDPGDRIGLLLKLFHEEFQTQQALAHERPVSGDTL